MEPDTSDLHDIRPQFQHRQNHLAFVPDQVHLIRRTEDHLQMMFSHEIQHQFNLLSGIGIFHVHSTIKTVFLPIGANLHNL